MCPPPRAHPQPDPDRQLRWHCCRCGAQWRLITHRVYDEAERLFGKTATLIPNSPQGHSRCFSSTIHCSICPLFVTHPTPHTPPMAPIPPMHTPLPASPALQPREIYCSPRLLWANTNKMLFCCNLFNWPQKRRLEHVQALPAPACPPGSHMLSRPWALSPWL